MNRTRMVSSVRCAVEIMGAPPDTVDAAFRRPHYRPRRRLSMAAEVLLLLVGLANFLGELIPADAVAHPGAQLPLQRFRLRVDPRPELIESPVDLVGIDLQRAGRVAD